MKGVGKLKEKVFTKKNLTVPNLLSCIRLAVIIPLIVFIANERYIASGVVLLISAVSDMLDGFLARALDQVTALGKVLDPIADKLTLIAVVFSLGLNDPVILRFVAVLLTKEALMLAGGFILIKKNIRPPAAKWFGKMATVIFYISVTVIVVLKAIWGITNNNLTGILFTVTTGAMLFALIMYTAMFAALLRGKVREINIKEKMSKKFKKDNEKNKTDDIDTKPSDVV